MARVKSAWLWVLLALVLGGPFEPFDVYLPILEKVGTHKQLHQEFVQISVTADTQGNALPFQQTVMGFELPDAAQSNVYGYWIVPDGASNVAISAVVLAAADGEIVLYNSAVHSGLNERIWQYHDFVGPVAVSMPTELQSVGEFQLTQANAGDLVVLRFYRNGLDPTDTIDASVMVFGWLVTYTTEG